MQLPKSVQDAVKQSDDLQKQLNEPKPEDQKGTTPLPESGTPDGTKDTLPSDVDDQTPPAQAPEEDWEQKYLTLQGKFNAQVPRLQQDIRRLQGQMSAIANENQQLKEAATKPQTQDDHGDPALDKDSFSEYGEEFGTLVDTIEKLRTDNATLAQQLKSISGDITDDRQANAQANYDGYMAEVSGNITKLGGNFSDLNSDPKFLNWLRQYPEGEAESRHAKLLRAESGQNSAATMEIFTEYLRPTQKQKPKPPTPNVQPPPSPTASGIPVQPEGRMWTRAEISQFFQDKVKGVFKGKEEEAAQIEADIHAAPGQGRVS